MKTEDANPSKDPLDKLEEILSKANLLSNEIAEQGRSQTEKGQLNADLSKSMIDIVRTVPKGTYLKGIEDTIEDWEEVVKQSNDVISNSKKIDLRSFANSSGTVTIASTDFVENIRAISVSDEHPLFQAAAESVEEILERSADLHWTVEVMKTFGLDQSFQNRIPVTQQFQTAYNALNRPVSSQGEIASTSLLPLREAVETMLDHLLHLRPKRTNLSEAEGENRDWRKVTAIAEQLKVDSIQKVQINAWARDWQKLKKDSLSPSKTEVIGRDEWRRRVNKATLFILSFLQGLDSVKLNRTQ